LSVHLVPLFAHGKLIRFPSVLEAVSGDVFLVEKVKVRDLAINLGHEFALPDFNHFFSAVGHGLAVYGNRSARKFLRRYSSG
jgi:hypothetical protein